MVIYRTVEPSPLISLFWSCMLQNAKIPFSAILDIIHGDLSISLFSDQCTRECSLLNLRVGQSLQPESCFSLSVTQSKAGFHMTAVDQQSCFTFGRLACRACMHQISFKVISYTYTKREWRNACRPYTESTANNHLGLIWKLALIYYDKEVFQIYNTLVVAYPVKIFVTSFKTPSVTN